MRTGSSGYQRREPAGVDLVAVAQQRGPVVLDEHIDRFREAQASDYQRSKRRARTFQLRARYADDWCLAAGTREDAETLREEIAGVLSGMGLRRSPEKTLSPTSTRAWTSSGGASSAAGRRH